MQFARIHVLWDINHKNRSNSVICAGAQERKKYRVLQKIDNYVAPPSVGAGALSFARGVILAT